MEKPNSFSTLFSIKTPVIAEMFDSDCDSDNENDGENIIETESKKGSEKGSRKKTSEKGSEDWKVYNTKRVSNTDITKIKSSMHISMEEFDIYIRFINQHKDILLKLYANKLTETCHFLNQSDISYTKQFTYISPTKYDLLRNNEVSNYIFIGEWWKNPEGKFFKGKHYPTIKDPSDKTLSFKILTQAYLGRIRQFAFFKDCHHSHIDQLTRIAAALRIRISSDNHHILFKPITLIHQIWFKASFSHSPPSFLPFISWCFT